MTVYFQGSIGYYKPNESGRATACPCGHFQTNRTLTNFLNKIDSEADNIQKLIDIKGVENVRKMNQMGFDEFIDQVRLPITKSDKIDEFLSQIVELARHSDMKDYEFLDFR